MATTQETTPYPGPQSHKPADPNLLHISLVIVFGIIATTLAQPEGLSSLTLRLYLKDHLHATKSNISMFFFVSGFFWYIKPISGILTDAFPIFGTRRRHYLLISAVLAAGAWIIVAITPHTFNILLGACVFLGLFMVMASTVVGGYLVEAGQSLGSVGRLSSVRQVAYNFCSIISGPAGGWVASLGILAACGLSAGILVALVPIVYYFLREAPKRVSTDEKFHDARTQCMEVLGSWTLWGALIFIGLFYFCPGFGTVLLFKQKDELHFSDQTIGYLTGLQGLTGLLAAVLYGFVVKRVKIVHLLIIGILANSAWTLTYTHYDSLSHAVVIDGLNQFFFAFAEVALVDLAARATPSGCEGLGYALILSSRNWSLKGADWVGSALSDHHWAVPHVNPFNSLVFLNAGTTALVLVLLPLLPKVVMNKKDGQVGA